MKKLSRNQIKIWERLTRPAPETLEGIRGTWNRLYKAAYTQSLINVGDILKVVENKHQHDKTMQTAKAIVKEVRAGLKLRRPRKVSNKRRKPRFPVSQY